MKSYTQDDYQIIFPQKIGDYDVIDIIGCGSTCVVALVQHQSTKEKFSAKVISKKNIKEKHLLPIIQNEIDILKSFNHPNIIKIYENFEIKNENDEELYIIITEYCENGDLLEFCSQKKFKNEIEKKKIFFKFLSAIQYLHNKGISHGDIKGENILLDKHLNPKLCDFGYARKKIIAGNESKNGTIYYSAPELFVPGKFCTLDADIYSIGILLYSLNELHFPFENDSTKEIILQIVSGKLSFRPGIDDRLKQIVTKCTYLNPYERPTIEDVINDYYFAEIILIYLINQKNYKLFAYCFILYIKTLIKSTNKEEIERIWDIYQNIIILNIMNDHEKNDLKDKFKLVEKILHLYINTHYGNVNETIKDMKLKMQKISKKNSNYKYKLYENNKKNFTKIEFLQRRKMKNNLFRK